jgi:hypothetical protein
VEAQSKAEAEAAVVQSASINKQEIIRSARQEEPQVTCRGRLELLPGCALDPLEEMRVELKTLEVVQKNNIVGKIVAPTALRALAETVERVKVTVAGSRMGAHVPIEVAVFGSNKLEGFADVVGMCLRLEKIPNVHKQNEACMGKRPLGLVCLRSSVLCDVLFPDNALSWEANTGECQMSTEVLNLVVNYISLDCVLRCTQVCKAWWQAIDNNTEFWNSLMWWDAFCAINNAALNAQITEPRLATWMPLLEQYNRLNGRQRVLQMLSYENSCDCCGATLQGRFRNRALKSRKALAGVGAVSHLTRVCVDCINQFCIPLQVARLEYPHLQRADHADCTSFKLDDRKCFLLSEIKFRLNVKHQKQLEADAHSRGYFFVLFI